MPPVNRNDRKRTKCSDSQYSLMEFTREFPDDAGCLEHLGGPGTHRMASMRIARSASRYDASGATRPIRAAFRYNERSNPKPMFDILLERAAT